MKLNILYISILIIIFIGLITNQTFSKYNIEEKILIGTIEIIKNENKQELSVNTIENYNIC